MITELYLYPIKSCAGIRVKSLQITPAGIHHDRKFVVVDKDGKFLTQRQIPQMCQITPTIENKLIKVSAPGMNSIELMEEGDEKKLVTVWSRISEGQLLKREVNQWFSDFLKKDVLVVSNLSSEINFVDSSPMLVISEASLSAVNSQLGMELPMNRFRPNVVIAECTPWAEDRLQSFKLNHLEFTFIKHCSRCVMICTDQISAKVYAEPLKGMAQFRRRNTDGKIVFGSFFKPNGVGMISEGEKFIPLLRQSAEIQ